MTTRSYILLAAALMLAGGCEVPPRLLVPTPVGQRHEIDPVTGRGYWIYVPSTYVNGRPAPVIVTCHGTPPYDVAEMHIREWKMLGEQHGCIILSPELSGTDGIFGDGPVNPMLDDEKLILSILSLTSYRYTIDWSNIMITGFSGGGFPMYWVGLRNPNVFSCMVARSCNFNAGNLDGWYPQEALAENVLIYYGEHDPGPIQTQSLAGIEYLRNRGFRIEEKMIPNIGHERVPEVAMDFFLRNMRPSSAVR